MKTFNNLTKSGEWAITASGFMQYLTKDRTFAEKLMAEKPEKKDSTETLRGYLSDFINQKQPMQVKDNCAIIHVYGVLLDDATPLDLAMGNTDYQEIINEIEEANQNPLAKKIILCLDSPGGMVRGMKEALASINQSNKSIYAYVEGSCTSACYALASQCSLIASTHSGEIGNIGTVMSWTDYSKLLESNGIKIETLTNEGADLKGTFREMPMTAEQRSFLQGGINHHGSEFWYLCKNKRPQINEECKRAGWYSPEQAGQLGLIDIECDQRSFLKYISEIVDIEQN